MKKLSLSIACLLALGGVAHAQRSPYFQVFDSIDINKFNLTFTPFGLQDHSVYDTPFWHQYNWYYPNQVRSVSNLWMSGYDGANTLHAGYQTYLQQRQYMYQDPVTLKREIRYGSNYWPGPLAGTGYQDHATAEKWAKIWKVSASDVVNFLQLPSLNTSNVPPSILTWPAKGNSTAQGKGGAPLVINEDMAPFVDKNGNGIYEPLLGEYPDFNGDQALWWVYSDRGFSDTDECENPTGVEVRQMVYAYNRGQLLDKTVYFDYTLVNRSANDYHDFRVAQWNDIDLGWYYDDFIGYDSAHRMGIAYNGTNEDGSAGGQPVNGFGYRPPMFGCMMISLPGDAGQDRVPAGSYMYYNNDRTLLGNPENTLEYSNYMRAKWRDGEHVRNDHQGVGVHTTGYGTGPDCNYVYTGDPADITQWSECAANNEPSDRRYIHASNDFTLNAGARQHVVMAVMKTDTGVGGCPAASFAAIKDMADTVLNAFENPPLQIYERRVCCGSPTELAAWPNPASNKYYINAAENTSITVYNSMGQTIKVPIAYTGTKYELDISGLPKGLYNAVCVGKDKTNLKFLKQ